MPAVKNLKRHRRYLFYRYYCGMVLVVWNSALVYLFWGRGTQEFPWWLPLMAIGVVPAIFMVLNLLMVPFDYGVFGKYERTPFPESGLIEKTSSSVRIGLVNSNVGVTFFLFDTGLGLSMAGFGRFFIPFKDIRQIKKNLLSYTIEHRSKELSGSIVLYSRDFGKHLAEIFISRR